MKMAPHGWKRCGPVRVTKPATARVVENFFLDIAPFFPFVHPRWYDRGISHWGTEYSLITHRRRGPDPYNGRDPG